VQAEPCAGRLALRRPRKGRRALLLGARSASIAAHRRRTVVVKLRRSRLVRHRRSRARIAFTGRDASGNRRTVSRRVVLRRP
jgi:hypothetical protein